MSNLFQRYHVELQFLNKIYGGVPKNPKIVEDWLKTRIGDGADEYLADTMRDVYAKLAETDGFVSDTDAVNEAADMVAKEKHTNGFFRDAAGPYIEARQVKAMVKECVAVLFPYPKSKWGQGKSPKNFLAEYVFVAQQRITLAPDITNVELVVKHVQTPKGKIASMTYMEYVEEPLIAFDLMVLRDAIQEDQWDDIWEYAGWNGLGARRSQSAGQFQLVQFVPITADEYALATRSNGHRSGVLVSAN